MTVRIINADVFEGLRQLPDESVHCVVTSPPYWGLRDYGVAGQLGLERTLGEHLEVMVSVFREVRRVLRKDGTLWLNYGDCYATAPNGRSAADTKAVGNDDRTFRDKPFSTIGPIYDPSGGAKGGGYRGNNRQNSQATPDGRVCAGGTLKPKDLCMVPNRIAIALQDDGWWVRSEIIWHKPNPMPESIKDRPGTSHEKVWLLSRSERYFYDAAAVAEPVTASTIERVSQSNYDNQEGSYRQPGKQNGPMKAVVSRSGNKARKFDDAVDRPQSHLGRSIPWEGATRNCRNVWTIGTQAFPEAHFATFPPELAERCIKAGCPKDGMVLDPFGGSGTTGLVADRLGRNCILIELNPEYAAMAERRIANDAPMFTNVTRDAPLPFMQEAAE